MNIFDMLAAAFGPKSKPMEPGKTVGGAVIEPPTPEVSQIGAISPPILFNHPTFAPPTEVAASSQHGVGIRVDHLVAMGASQANAMKFCAYINDACEKFEINNNARICAFIAQTFEETGNLNAHDEDLRYSAARMMQVWPRKFASLEQAQAAVNGGAPAIAEAIYGGRKDLGNVVPGDGYRFRGRGFIQLTGRANYTVSSKGCGVDFVANPDLVSQPEYCALTAAEYWKRVGCNELCAPDNEEAVKVVTKRVNGGYISLDKRIANWRKAEQVFKDLK